LGDVLRDSAVSFYAKAKAIRYSKSKTSSVISNEGRCLAAAHRKQTRPEHKPWSGTK
jgi:hypothetical protein